MIPFIQKLLEALLKIFKRVVKKPQSKCTQACREKSSHQLQSEQRQMKHRSLSHASHVPAQLLFQPQSGLGMSGPGCTKSEDCCRNNIQGPGWVQLSMPMWRIVALRMQTWVHEVSPKIFNTVFFNIFLTVKKMPGRLQTLLKAFF